MTILTRREVLARSLTPDWVYANGDDVRHFLEIGNIRDITNFDNDERDQIYKLPKTPEGKWCHRRMSREEIAAFRTPMIAPFYFWPVHTEGGNLTSPPPDAPEPEFGEMVSWRTPIKKVVPYGMERESGEYGVRIGNLFQSFAIDIVPSPFFKVEDAYELPPGNRLVAVTEESFTMPADVTAFSTTKDVYGIAGLKLRKMWIPAGIVDFHAVVIIDNNTDAPQKIFAKQGIARLQFRHCE